MVIGLVLIIHSSYFEVKQIMVVGNHQLSTAEILKIVGNFKGQNIFLVPGRKIVNRLMNHVRIKGVKLERKLPDTLIIRVNERYGLALFRDLNNNWVEISKDGLILGIYKNNSRPDLPVVEGLQVKTDGNNVEMTDELADLLVLLKALFPLQKKMSEVSYYPENIKIIFHSGTTLYLGEAVNLEKKVTVFRSIWEEIQNKKIEYIDLRYEGKPVIKLK